MTWRRYEVLYNQLGVGRLIEWIQLGLLDHTRPITMKVRPAALLLPSG